MNRQWVFFGTVTGNLFDYLEPSMKHNQKKDYRIRVIPLAVCTSHYPECEGIWYGS